MIPKIKITIITRVRALCIRPARKRSMINILIPFNTCQKSAMEIICANTRKTGNCNNMINSSNVVLPNMTTESPINIIIPEINNKRPVILCDIKENMPNCKFIL